MKKIIILCVVLLATAVIATSCRDDESEFSTPGSQMIYDTPSEQFIAIWKSMNTSYVMWDIDPTDWDAVYNEYYPKFLALDKRLEDDDDATVSTAELKELYEGVFSTLIDHHLGISVWNKWGGNDVPVFSIANLTKELSSRDYYHPRHLNTAVFTSSVAQPHLLEIYGMRTMEDHSVVQHLRVLEAQGRATQIKYGYCSYMTVISALIDGNIPYLHFDQFNFFNLINHYILEEYRDNSNNPYADAYRAYNNFYSNVIALENLGGVIIDVRENYGGYVRDQQDLLGLLIDEPVLTGYQHYKMGFGKYDYSPWTPLNFYPNDTRHRTGYNKPVVILADLYSISMAEITTMMAQQMPNGCVIGERTVGGQGTSSGDFEGHYSGSFGSESGPHYVTFSDHPTRTVDGKSLEGIGVTPDIPMKTVLSELTNGNDTWIDRAVTYIHTGH